MGDARELAEMLRQMGRGDDTILAHITPEEAAMLKEAGGSGEINPMTGLPEFQEEDDYGRLLASEFEDRSPQEQSFNRNYSTAPNTFSSFLEEQNIRPTQNQLNFTPVNQRSQLDDYQDRGSMRGLDNQFSGEPGLDLSRLDQPSFLPPDAQQEMALADQQRSEPSPFGRDGSATDENIFRRGERGLDELSALLNRFPNLSRLGTAGIEGLGTALIARRANRQREAQAAAERARAVPFRQAEQEALARARGGGLSPQDARRLEAQQAKARQDLSARNQGVGSAAAGILAGQEQRTRSVAREESLNEALKVAGIADQYERQAIAAELAADREMSQLYAKVLSNMVRSAGTTQAAPRRD